MYSIASLIYLLQNPNIMRTLTLSLLIITVLLLVSKKHIFSQGCAELFISEYIEGSSSNKALEIYNPTSFTIDLTPYSIRLYYNGATDTNGFVKTIDLVGAIPSGQVFVVADDNIDTTQFNPSIIDSFVGGISLFNGDDAITLYKDSTLIDMIGKIGEDPGTQWQVDTGSTAKHTLTRKIHIKKGQLDWAIGANEWDVSPNNTSAYLGYHDNCCIDTLTLSFFYDSDSACEFDKGVIYSVGHITGTTYQWNIVGAVGIIGENTHEVAVDWGAYGVGELTITATHINGCKSSKKLTIYIKKGPSAGFTSEDTVYLNNGGYCNFMNTTTPDSSNTKYSWDFGDSTANTCAKHPIHRYKEPGSYEVKLTATHSGCSNTFQKTVIVMESLSVNATQRNVSFSIAPNPSSNEVILNFNQWVYSDIDFSIYNLLGAIVYSETYHVSGVKRFKIDLKEYKEGSYFVKITLLGKTTVKKLILIHNN